ncbi:hypothetical protein ACWFMI_24770 [Nocardiopsis terrae]|uniref:hypothetical protein n=1 Tax=Streptomyces sp. NPDC057554 TaxID=3350538 RepID=UPI0036804A48
MTDKPVIPELEELARKAREADEALVRGIRAELKARDGKGLSLIGRSVGWAPQYIAKIRDGQARADVPDLPEDEVAEK